MAEVHAGTNIRTERSVAIKRLLSERGADRKHRARFEREARAIGRVSSPHVVEIVDIDRDEQGRPFIVMELLTGVSLHAELKRSGRLDPKEAVDIAGQLLDGVAAAHAAGVIHRDLKPSNIFLEGAADGLLVKIVDFGISKISDEEPTELTRDGETLGTFAYMPPEQVRKSTAVGPQADLWAIGVTLFRMLSGRNPFANDDPMELLLSVLERDAPRLADVVDLPADLRGALQEVLDGALAKDSGDRYSSAEAMKRALEPAARIVELDPRRWAGARPVRLASAPDLVASADDPTRMEASLAVGETTLARVVPHGPPAWAVTAAAALVGGAVGWVAVGAGVPSDGGIVSIETVPGAATVHIGGNRVVDPLRIPTTDGEPKVATISAAAYEPRTVALPARSGSRFVVALRPSSAHAEPVDLPVPATAPGPTGSASPSVASGSSPPRAAASVRLSPVAPRPAVRKAVPSQPAGEPGRPPVIRQAPY